MSDSVRYQIEEIDSNPNPNPNPNGVPQYILDHIAETKPNIVFLTPCYNSSVYVSYTESLIQTMNMCKELGIEASIQFCRNDSLVSRARNNLIAKAMSNKDATHFMFIDADITWNAFDILKLLVADKPIVGGIYPIKHYNWDRFAANPNTVGDIFARKEKSQFKNTVSNEDYLQTNMVRYNINYVSNVLEVEKNLTKVRHLATGFMLLKRNVIEVMSKAFPQTKYVDDVNFLSGSENDYAFALFDCGVEDGHYLSEDWMFCHRWAKMGGSVYADITINLDHTGIETYKGAYITSIM
jgi:hypothetical protein